VKIFTDKVAQTGQCGAGGGGEPLEGFVVRTSIINLKLGTTSISHVDLKRPPYPAGSSFFFKVKFDES
jgi:tRNA ligase